MTLRLTILCLTALAACSQTPDPRLGATRGEQVQTAYTQAFGGTPFADGAAIRIVAPDLDPVRGIETFALVPCRDGTAICGGSAQGPAGTISNVEGRTRISGAYPGVEFYLDRAGSGYLARGERNIPIAWE